MTIMDNGFIENTMHWFTTPEELRKIASQMEEKYKNDRPSNSNIVKHVELGTTDSIIYCIDIHYDQERMQ